MRTYARAPEAPKPDRAAARKQDWSAGVGRPLERSLRASLEPRLGFDLANIRVHADRGAAALAAGMGAHALTIGPDIFLGHQEGRHETPEGQHLMAHEIWHSAQQGAIPPLPGHARSPSHAPAGQAQAKLSVGAQVLDDAGALAIADQLVGVVLADLVRDDADRLTFSSAYLEQLIRQTVQDMHDAADTFVYTDRQDLASEVRRRVLTATYMRQSQGSKTNLSGFSYPNNRGDGTENCGPRVNKDAGTFWGPVQKGADGHYLFELSPAGLADPYQAIVHLFTEQSDPCLRTLIHCDYVVSVIHMRAYAETVGTNLFNQLVQQGTIPLVLRWNGFEGLMSLVRAPMVEPLTRTAVSNKSDLVVGDHVVFANHLSYDVLNKNVGAAWRLENAIVTGHQGSELMFQGHGYFSPVTEAHMLAGMIRQYNKLQGEAKTLADRVSATAPGSQARAAAQTRLSERYPNVQPKVGGGWEIVGSSNYCGASTLIRRDLVPLTVAEAPGLQSPCDGKIRVKRPSEGGP